MRKIPKNKRYALGWYNEGVTLLSIHEYEEAMTFFENALKAIPNHPDFLIGRGDTHLSMGHYEEALEDYKSAINEEHDNFRAWMRSGNALIRMGKYERALETFKTAINMFEYDGEIWLGYGIALVHLHRTGEAKEALQKAMRLKPNQPALWYFLSTIEENDTEALKLLVRGNRMDPNNTDILIEMVKRLLNLKAFDKAAEVLKRAYSVNPENTLIRSMIDHYSRATGRDPF
jgi:tetratricopeptide (TPR) repeat protein